MEYYEKYLKYKNKYLELQSIYGGKYTKGKVKGKKNNKGNTTDINGIYFYISTNLDKIISETITEILKKNTEESTDTNTQNDELQKAEKNKKDSDTINNNVVNILKIKTQIQKNKKNFHFYNFNEKDTLDNAPFLQLIKMVPITQIKYNLTNTENTNSINEEIYDKLFNLRLSIKS